ncbi:MAG: DUF4838 domain-containing protein [Clostridia bacterium]|nr:DUF4838 domain-containing protein [Clostridia bacterium]
MKSKKILSLVLVLCMLLPMLPVFATAATQTGATGNVRVIYENDFENDINGWVIGETLAKDGSYSLSHETFEDKGVLALTSTSGISNYFCEQPTAFLDFDDIDFTSGNKIVIEMSLKQSGANEFGQAWSYLKYNRPNKSDLTYAKADGSEFHTKNVSEDADNWWTMLMFQADTKEVTNEDGTTTASGTNRVAYMYNNKQDTSLNVMSDADTSAEWTDLRIVIDEGTKYFSVDGKTGDQEYSITDGWINANAYEINNTNIAYGTQLTDYDSLDNLTLYLRGYAQTLWLADGSNNKCECDECKKLRISDWYVMMLNMLDEKLTKEGIDTRIVFIVYVDTFWPPIKEKFKNNDRFLLQYAPITRTYTSSFKSSKKGEMLPYELNKLTFPTKVEDNLEYLRAWKKNFSCDSVIFDYHFTWDHYLDFPQYNHARILSEDIKSLEDIGLNGLMNCKVQRTYLPSSLGVNVMADTLWNKESDFEAISDSVLRAEFGDAYTKVKEYLSDLSVYGCPKAFRGEESFVENDNIDSIKKAVDIIKNFRSVLQKEMCTSDSKVMFAWKKLEFFSDLYELLLNFTLDSVQKDEIADDSELRDFVQKNEMWIKDEFDAMYFLMVFQSRILRVIKNDKELFLGNADN